MNYLYIRKIVIKLLITLLVVIGFMLLDVNEVQGAWVSSDINGIDESRYPGYKSLIQNLQAKYPNWNIKLYYTGLDWDSTLTAENEGHGKSPVSLSYYTYKGEWICPICGEQRFDVLGDWYCASRKAIAYMMDPRNSLTEEWVFQFQNLGSSAGNRSEIEKMVQGTFLNNTTCIDAIMQAAQTYNISPFHLVSRITQEQGTAGIGTMNGYIYITPEGIPVKVYNLFNIKTSGNDDAGLLAGAKFAYENGWFTQEASILGGAKFLREEYIDYGQNTLYFQKFNVVYTDKLYRHQYMQNIRAANDEGNKIYNAYKNCGILSSHFEFLIPVYENMPFEPAPRPLTENPKYRGDISTQINSIELLQSEKGSYIKGEIVVTEWIDGVTWSKPRKTPKIRIKSTDGRVSYEMWVSNIENNTYYFDGYIDGIDTSKEYEIEVESGSEENTSPYRIGKGYYNENKTLGQYRRHILSVSENVFKFTPTNYCGDIATQIVDTTLEKNEEGRPYLKGEILITEWLGTLWTVPDVTPEMTIISTDGTSQQQFWVKNIESNRYYFDGYIDGLDMTKEYVIRVDLKNTYNTSKYQSQNVTYTEDRELGDYQGAKIIIKDSKIIFEREEDNEGTYIGDIATQINSLELLQNEKGNYIRGEIIITEWINGVTWSKPRETPKIRIKSTDGTESYEMWVLNIESNTYYFDGYIDGIDTEKEYEIEVESGSVENTSPYRIGKGYYSENKELGMYKNKTMKIENNKIVFESDTYQGDIATQINSLELLQNEKGNYIRGEIIITEWINGVTWSKPRETPKIRIKSTDGTESYEMWVLNIESNTYYFDGYIDGIDTEKEYEIEVESGSVENTSPYRIGKGYYSENKELGKYKESNMKIENNIISFVGIKKKALREENAKEMINLNDELSSNKDNNIDNQDEKVITEEETEKTTNKKEKEALYKNKQSEEIEKNEIETEKKNETKDEEIQIENIQE